MAGSVHATGAGKQFRRYSQQAAPSLKQAMMRGFRRDAPPEMFWALRDIDLDVPSGSMLGIIGHNGSGKSTLLRLIGGVMRPDIGAIRTEGRLIGLLELNSGIHLELTGRENLLIAGVVSGMTLREVRARLDEIIEFAELGPFIDNPVRTYSAGMKLRLGFSVAVHAHPGVLLIDEVLAVGDMAFQQKCLERIRSFKEQGAAILFATHDLGQVTAMCDQALWLKRGLPIASGDPHRVTGEYRLDNAGQMRRHTPENAPDRLTAGGAVLRTGVNRYGSQEVEILDVRMLGADEMPVSAIECGDSLKINISLAAKEGVDHPILSVDIGTQDQEDIVKFCSIDDGVTLTADERQKTVTLEIGRLDLAPGEYVASVGLYRSDWDYAYDYHWRAYPLRITGAVEAGGLIRPPHRWVSG
jgi:lipopolysaccharide transport system ATP-binding protein